MEVLFIINTLCTFSLTGLIYFVQHVHYPLMSAVGDKNFDQYHVLHLRKTTHVVLPLMVTELITSFLLISYSPLLTLNFFLCLLIWGSTFLIQVPQHQRLSEAVRTKHIENLVRSNWLRTILWTVRSLTLLFILLEVSQ